MYRILLFCLMGTALCQVQQVLDAREDHWEPQLQLAAAAAPVVPAIRTSFSCVGRSYGYFADVDNACQIFHICHPSIDAKHMPVIYHYTKFCPKFTRFDQTALTCVDETNPRILPCLESPRFYPLTEARFADVPVINKGVIGPIAQIREPLIEQRREVPIQQVREVLPVKSRAIVSNIGIPTKRIVNQVVQPVVQPVVHNQLLAATVPVVQPAAIPLVAPKKLVLQKKIVAPLVKHVAPVISQPLVSQVVSQPLVSQVVSQPLVSQVVSQPLAHQVVAQPLAAHSVVAQPLAAQSVISQPLVSHQVISQPVAHQVVSQPLAAQSVAQPVVTQPLAAQTLAAQPVQLNAQVPQQYEIQSNIPGYPSVLGVVLQNQIPNQALPVQNIPLQPAPVAQSIPQAIPQSVAQPVPQALPQPVIGSQGLPEGFDERNEDIGFDDVKHEVSPIQNIPQPAPVAQPQAIPQSIPQSLLSAQPLPQSLPQPAVQSQALPVLQQSVPQSVNSAPVIHRDFNIVQTQAQDIPQLVAQPVPQGQQQPVVIRGAEPAPIDIPSASHQ